MLRFILPIFIIIVSITGFFLFVAPLYNEVKTLKTEVASYDVALNNSIRLENERDRLVAKYNSISPTNLEKLNKLLPDSVDSIRLILEIEKIASPYGMVLKDTRYNPAEKDKDAKDSNNVAGGSATKSNQNYGVWDLEFSTEGSYQNFLSLLEDLENNLRIVDISSIQFSSESVNTKASNDNYKYNFKIKTYWLKN